MPGLSFNPEKDIPDLSGKVILITGGNQGLGKQTALDLAAHAPLEIWIAARSIDSGNAIVVEINKSFPKVHARFLRLDLSSFQSVKEAARKFLGSTTRLDLFYMNAGIMGGPHVTTEDGYERQFGTNHMGHALLFKLLTPLLLKTASTGADIRTISLSSAGHRYGKKELLLDSMKSTAMHLSPTEKYCHSKLANLVYARALARQFPEITSVSVYPGDIRTGLFNSNGGSWMITFLRTIVLPLTSVSVEEGAKNQLWAATANGVVNGEYYEPVGVVGKASRQSTEDVDKFWKWTQKELEGHEI